MNAITKKGKPLSNEAKDNLKKHEALLGISKNTVLREIASVRLLNILKANEESTGVKINHLTKVEDIYKLSDTELYSFRGMGKTTLWEIKAICYYSQINSPIINRNVILHSEFTLYQINAIPNYISNEALDYWFTEQNLTSLIKILYKDITFSIGDFFDFGRLDSTHLNFSRDISIDFENILQITRKTYSSIFDSEGGIISTVNYELVFPNY